MKHGDPHSHTINVMITDSLNRAVATTFDWSDEERGKAKGTFIPTATGMHKVRLVIPSNLCDSVTVSQ